MAKKFSGEITSVEVVDIYGNPVKSIGQLMDDATLDKLAQIILSANGGRLKREGEQVGQA